MPAEAIRCEGLTRRYGNVLALDHLDLTVPEGVVFGFLGPNGAGKTTTIKLLTGLLHPTDGRALVAGQEIKVEHSQARTCYGYLPEDPVFYNWMTASELLSYAGQLFGMDGKVLRSQVPELLEMVGLKDAAKRKVGGFSRGMRQRLGLAQALINDPPVLILDEPVSAMDPIGRHETLALIRDLRQRKGITIFMSTHILADVEQTCDTVGIINKGRLVTVADQEELRQRFTVPLFVAELDGAEQDLLALRDTLSQLPWVERVERINHHFRILVRDAETAKKMLPGVLTGSHVVLLKYEIGMPSLEDVFLRLLK